jgi:uncharacterized membrane protein (DUF2068 family)
MNSEQSFQKVRHKALPEGTCCSQKNNWWHRAARVPWWLRLIALSKLAKAVGFIVLGLATLKVATFGVEQTIAVWLSWVHLDPDHGHVSKALELLKVTKSETLRHFGIGFFAYAGVLAVEAIGLWFDQTWAEWLVVGVASVLIPFEVYEITVHPTLARISALVINLLIVAALVWRLSAKNRPRATEPTVTPQA